jgi:hypothetical protein
MALPTPSPMIATKTAVLMAAMMIGVVGISVAAAPLVAEANQVNTTRSNIKTAAIGQQDADQACTNQAQGQGGQQAVPNTEQNTAGGDRSDPIPGVDVKLGKNPGGSGAGSGINSEGDPTVDAEQSVECSIAQEQTVENNGDTEDFSTNVWEG